jgi:hypothetical protein
MVTTKVVAFMRTRAWRFLRTLAGASITGALLVVAVAPARGSATAQSPVFVELHGAGAWSVSQQLVAWQNELASGTNGIDLNYVKHGSFLAREDLASKNLDFAVSGVPFTPDELAKAGGANAFISAPIQVATLATYVEPPTGGFSTIQVRCDPDDPSTWPNAPDPPPPGFDETVDCIVKSPYPGAVRIPDRNLGAMFLHYIGTPSSPLLAWSNSAVLQAFGVDAFALPNGAGPGFAGRSDPDEINYYLQTFIKTAAPDVWQGNAQANPAIPWEPITERVGQVVGVTRDGAEQQLAQLVQNGCGVLGNCDGTIAGGIAPAPPSMLSSFKQAFPKQPVTLAEIQNANGDWVAPTPDAINRAVDAGGESALYPLTHKAPGAYPLVWVDRLYAPAHGLTAEKTEALATTIRYLATTGQDHSTAVGEGRLPTALVTQALRAADDLVRSNCVGADREITTSADPGVLAPASAAAMKSIGPMLHCEATNVPVSTTTTSFPTSFGSTPGTTPLGSQSFGPAGSETGNASVSTASNGGEAASSTSSNQSDAPSGSGAKRVAAVRRSELLTATNLPLPMPGGASGTDRLATFLLGAMLFVLFRKPVGRLLRRLTI